MLILRAGLPRVEGAPVAVDVHVSHQPAAAHCLDPAVVLLAPYPEPLA